jgi:hypothetical protein
MGKRICEHRTGTFGGLQRGKGRIVTLDFIGQHGTRHLTNQAWSMLLRLARHAGWVPAGPLPPTNHDDADENNPIRELPGEAYEIDDEQGRVIAEVIKSWIPDDPLLRSYLSNEGKRVAAEDAAALAEALERALPDLPAHDALIDKTVQHPQLPGDRFVMVGTAVNPFEWFSGDKRQTVKDFIAFCRQGGFEIW